MNICRRPLSLFYYSVSYVVISSPIGAQRTKALSGLYDARVLNHILVQTDVDLRKLVETSVLIGEQNSVVVVEAECRFGETDRHSIHFVRVVPRFILATVATNRVTPLIHVLQDVFGVSRVHRTGWGCCNNNNDNDNDRASYIKHLD